MTNRGNNMKDVLQDNWLDYALMLVVLLGVFTLDGTGNSLSDESNNIILFILGAILGTASRGIPTRRNGGNE